MWIRGLLFLFFCQMAGAVTYEVGPAQSLQQIEQVPWAKLHAGDLVLIHGRAEPYRVKWLISVRGTEDEPVIIRGVPGTNGELPVISGENAITAPGLDYWGGERSVIKIGVGSVPKNISPSYVTVENLEVRSARPGYPFIPRKGKKTYNKSAAPIWIEAGDHITIRNCIVHDGANGIFVSKGGKNILIERCNLFANGLEKSDQQHNVYTEANGITFQFNHFEPLRPGARGNNLRDRSAGTVVRYNWIEGGNRELDLVDAEDSAAIRADPKYGKTFVYGNIIIEPNNPGDAGQQIVHYGGDSGHTNWYRKGILYFYNNTVISRRGGNTTLFRIQTGDEKVEARNNIIYWTAPRKHLAIVDSVGEVEMQNNWFKKGWTKCHERLLGSVRSEKNLEGDAPGFVDLEKNNFQLAPGSPCIGAGGPLPSEILPENDLKSEYVAHQSGHERASASDLGALRSEASKEIKPRIGEAAGTEKKP